MIRCRCIAPAITTAGSGGQLPAPRLQGRHGLVLQQLLQLGRRQHQPQQLRRGAGIDGGGQGISASLPFCTERLVQRQRFEPQQLVFHRLVRHAAHHKPQPPGAIAAVDPVTAFWGQAGAQNCIAEVVLRGEVSIHEQAVSGRAHRLQPQGEFGDQRQASPAAAEQPHQVVARHVFHHPSTGSGFDAISP